MPREQDVIYCVLVDDTGKVQSTSMISARRAQSNAQEALNLIKEGKIV
jgi:hypothetical protein